MIPAPRRREQGTATSADGTRIAWYGYGSGERAVLFLPTWNIVDARVVGHQVAALEPHATVVTYDPRGAGASDRPERGYDFPFHAADGLAVLDAIGIGQASLVTASRGLNAALVMIADEPQRFDRLAVVAPYMQLEAEPDSSEVIAEMIAIGLESTPEAVVAGEREIDWRRPARLLGTVACPTLVIHGEADVAVPASLARDIVAAMPNARLELIPDGGHRPDIRTPELVNPLLRVFLLDA